MENASKALIIAASILLAILIIALGVKVFNDAQNSYDDSSFDQTEINMANSKFERYSGEQLGTQVKGLISFAISNASTNKDDILKLPTIVYKGESTNITAQGQESVLNSTAAYNSYVNNLSSIRNDIVSTHTYKIEISYGNSGLINSITINYNF